MHIDQGGGLPQYDSFSECYYDLLAVVRKNPTFVCAPRGHKICERLAQGFVLTNPRHRLPLLPHRDLSISYAIAELVWYLSGSSSTEWISYYAPFWRGISDDGVSANSAYGARIFQAHKHQALMIPGNQFADGQPRSKIPPPGWSQWEYVKSELTRDPDSRRAVIHIRQPQDSIEAVKDVPCTLTLQFFVREQKLHLVASMRSSDLILGLPYDVIAFTIFQEMMALELGVGLGTYTHVSNSMHIYEKNFPEVEAILVHDRRDWGDFELPGHEPMHPMPSRPPVWELELVEKLLRGQSTAEQIEGILDGASVLQPIAHSYWRDWLKVLASNRAKKIGDLALQRKLLDSTSQRGFSAFKR